MLQVHGPRADGNPPRIAFNNLVAGFTTPLFFLPLGFAELQLYSVDPNNPGVLSLEDQSGNVLFTLNTSVGVGADGPNANSGLHFSGVPRATGSLYFETPALGGTYQINVTQAAKSVLIYFNDQYN
jgi:hypothetical protein